MSKRTATPVEAIPALCRFCGQPATGLRGIVPVCAVCSPVVRERTEINLRVMLAFFREIEVRSGAGNVEEQGAA